MKKIGILVLIIGIVSLLVTLGMDTTVQTSRSYERVHNIGLMNEKQNFLLISVAMAIAGVIILTIGIRNDPLGKNQNSTFTNRATRTCPYCAELIKAQAIVCKYCGRDVIPPADSTGLSSPALDSPDDSAVHKNISGYFVQIENYLNGKFSQIASYSPVSSALKFLARLEKNLDNIAIFLMAFALIAFIYVIGFADYSEWKELADRVRMSEMKDSALVFLSGLYLILRNSIKKPFDPSYKSSDANKSSWLFFGEVIDLVLIQLTMVLLLVVTHRGDQMQAAYVLAILIAATGYLLTRMSNRLIGYATIICGALYVIYRHTRSYRFDPDLITYKLTYPHGGVLDQIYETPFIWLLVASVAIPHLKSIRFGGFQYGRLYGDVSFTIAGHTIFLPLMSALFISILWCVMLNFFTYGYNLTIRGLS